MVHGIACGSVVQRAWAGFPGRLENMENENIHGKVLEKVMEY